MIAWLNLFVLIFASLFFLYFYVISAGPAALEMVIGPSAYPRCAQFRMVAMVFELITILCYVLYRFFPLPTSLPENFPWSWWVSGLIALVIAAPTITLMLAGLKDAGKEALTPRKEHTMYGGIYTHIRHPQAVGEVFGWLWIAFLLHSPFLAVFSLIYIPIFLVMSWSEEQDLLIRYGEAYASYMRRTGAFIPHRPTHEPA